MFDEEAAAGDEDGREEVTSEEDVDVEDVTPVTAGGGRSARGGPSPFGRAGLGAKSRSGSSLSVRIRSGMSVMMDSSGESSTLRALAGLTTRTRLGIGSKVSTEGRDDGGMGDGDGYNDGEEDHENSSCAVFGSGSNSTATDLDLGTRSVMSQLTAVGDDLEPPPATGLPTTQITLPQATRNKRIDLQMQFGSFHKSLVSTLTHDKDSDTAFVPPVPLSLPPKPPPVPPTETRLVMSQLTAVGADDLEPLPAARLPTTQTTQIQTIRKKPIEL